MKEWRDHSFIYRGGSLKCTDKYLIVPKMYKIGKSENFIHPGCFTEMGINLVPIFGRPGPFIPRNKFSKQPLSLHQTAMISQNLTTD